MITPSNTLIFIKIRLKEQQDLEHGRQIINALSNNTATWIFNDSCVIEQVDSELILAMIIEITNALEAHEIEYTKSEVFRWSSLFGGIFIEEQNN